MKAKTVKEMLNEDYREDELNPGELRALAQGKDVLSKSQMAACYLSAKNSKGRAEDANTTFAGKMATRMNKNEEETDFQRVSIPRLADMLDLSVRTVSYTVSKFRLLLEGNREGTLGNVMYEKIIYYFDLFQKMQPGEVYSLALEAIDPDADFSRSEEFSEQSKKLAEKKKKSEKAKVNLAAEIVSIFNQYKPLGDEKAAKQTLKVIENKYSMSRDEIIKIIKASKIEPSIKKIFLNL